MKTDLQTRKHWDMYHPPSLSARHRVKKNVVFISNANTVRHELHKCIGALMYRRFGDIKTNAIINAAVRAIEDEILAFGFVKNPSHFISECTPNSEPERRVDLVGLKENFRFEWENDHKIEKKEGTDGSKTITFYI